MRPWYPSKTRRGLGWLTGAIPSMFGSNAVFAMIEIVETFVNRHYQAQIDRLRFEDGDPAIINLLDRLRRDEVEHRDEAAARRTDRASLPLRIWTWLVELAQLLRCKWRASLDARSGD